MKITATFHDESMTATQNRMQNLKPFYEAGGELLVNSMMKNFEEQGRPTKWKPLASSTLLGGAGYGGRRFLQNRSATKGFERHLRGKQILITRGMLKNSIKKEATAEHALVGSNLKYAAVHNFGGQAGRGRKALIPARPFVMAQAEDRVQLRKTLRRWVVLGQ